MTPILSSKHWMRLRARWGLRVVKQAGRQTGQGGGRSSRIASHARSPRRPVHIRGVHIRGVLPQTLGPTITTTTTTTTTTTRECTYARAHTCVCVCVCVCVCHACVPTLAPSNPHSTPHPASADSAACREPCAAHVPGLDLAQLCVRRRAHHEPDQHGPVGAHKPVALQVVELKEPLVAPALPHIELALCARPPRHIPYHTAQACTAHPHNTLIRQEPTVHVTPSRCPAQKKGRRGSVSGWGFRHTCRVARATGKRHGGGGGGGGGSRHATDNEQAWPHKAWARRGGG